MYYVDEIKLMGKLNLPRILAIALAVITILGALRFLQPISPIKPQSVNAADIPANSISIPWPSYGQAAIGASGYGVLAANGTQAPVPIASIAKVVTAMAVLKQKPLSIGQQGPTITIGPDDVASYNTYYSEDGSVTKVVNGETISEYQALQVLLLPSANNIADTLARWAFGSMDAYVSYANQMVKGMNLSQTKIAGASGFSDQTISSANDLVNLGIAALDQPVLAQIVSQEQATVPVAGTITNVNWLLGEDGVVGIKTGNTDQAGGCYLFASKRSVSGHTITLIGAVLGAPNLNTAISNSKNIVENVDQNFETAKVITKDQIVGFYKTPWGASAQAVAQQDMEIFRWKGAPITTKVKLDNLRTKSNQQVVGTLTVASGNQSFSAPVILSGNLKPPFAWRFYR